jgi:carbonic anhydrase
MQATENSPRGNAMLKTKKEYELTADEALAKLMEGNKRYVEFKLLHPNKSPARRKELTDGQHPFAIILGCSDSRVPPGDLFDIGLGDLFVVRVAGNVTGVVVQESIEYAAAHLHCPLVMVLSHSQCGAVTATVESGTPSEGMVHQSKISRALQPAINSVKDQEGNLINNAAKANAKMVAEKLTSNSPILSELVKKGTLKIIPAYYSLETGAVEILS